MYINKEWKFYKNTLVELTNEEILELLNSKQEKKLELEDNNLWKPTNPEINIWDKNASNCFPQAWNNNWNWYYNWTGAVEEAKYLWKKIPTKEQWEEIVKPFWNDWKSLSEKLNLPFAGYRGCSNGHYNNQSADAVYWSSTPNSNYADYLSFVASYIYPAYGGSRANGFSVRCLKD